MRSLAFYNTATNPIHQQLIISFADKVGIDITQSKEYKECDIAVIFGSWKKQSKKDYKASRAPHHKLKNDIIDNHRGKVIVFETPLLNRTITQNHESYRVGLNHFMRGLADFKNHNSTPDRFNSMGIDIKSWRNKGEHVLLVGQNMNDASLFGLNFEWWVENTIRMLLKNTERPIVVRDHPENKELLKNVVADRFGYTNQVIYDTNTDIKDSFKNAHCTVSYTSGSSVDSLIAGVPVITCCEYNFLWPISSHSLTDVDSPLLADNTVRKQLLYDLAWTQWSVNEIKEGKPWEHLIEN